MIIGICGLIGSGKGTVADLLVTDHEFIKVSFADGLKDCVAAVFGWPRHLLEGDSEESRIWREQPDPWWAKKLDIPHLTPRWILQYWGTEVCRHGFHDDIWIASLEYRTQYQPANYVIPDTRFPNEINMISRNGGKIWWIQRGELPEWFNIYQSNGIIPDGVHPSEYLWARSTFTDVIANNDTVESLKQRVAALIKDVNI
jgi:hypothetical protein